MNKKIKLISAIIGIFIIMPINGLLFTMYPMWFPLLLICTQIPFMATILYEWYKTNEDVRVDNLPGHRNPPNPPRDRVGIEL